MSDIDNDMSNCPTAEDGILHAFGKNCDGRTTIPADLLGINGLS